MYPTHLLSPLQNIKNTNFIPFTLNISILLFTPTLLFRYEMSLMNLCVLHMMDLSMLSDWNTIKSLDCDICLLKKWVKVYGFAWIFFGSVKKCYLDFLLTHKSYLPGLVSNNWFENWDFNLCLCFCLLSNNTKFNQ
jgi:hypothetical protein